MNVFSTSLLGVSLDSEDFPFPEHCVYVQCTLKLDLPPQTWCKVLCSLAEDEYLKELTLSLKCSKVCT